MTEKDHLRDAIEVTVRAIFDFSRQTSLKSEGTISSEWLFQTTLVLLMTVMNAEGVRITQEVLESNVKKLSGQTIKIGKGKSENKKPR